MLMNKPYDAARRSEVWERSDNAASCALPTQYLQKHVRKAETKYTQKEGFENRGPHITGKKHEELQNVTPVITLSKATYV